MKLSNDISKKLLLHKATNALIMNEPNGYLDMISSSLPANVQIVSEYTDSVDFIQLFVKDSSELGQYLESALKVLEKDGYLWICYPKKSSKIKSDLNRDILVSLLREKNHEGVSLVSVDDTWSAMRVRPAK